MTVKRVAVLVLVLSITGCPELNSFLKPTESAVGPLLSPTIETTSPQLRRAPSLAQLAAYYCPRVIHDPFVRMGCAAALGPAPSPEQLAFEFGLTLTAKNPNHVPVPALDVLVGLTLFPGQDAEALGAICVTLGAQAAGPDACTATNRDVRTWDGLAARVPGLIAGLASGQALDQLQQSSIVASGDLRVDFAFTIGVEPALRVIEKVARRFVEDAMTGRGGALDLPVSLAGTLFVQLPAVGRVGVGFGPIATTWRLPSVALAP